MKYNEEGNVVAVPGPSLKLVTVLDPHFSPIAPAARTDDFLESTEDAFRQTIRFAVKVNASAIVIAGDIFHLKSGQKNPHWFMRRIIRLFKEARKEGILVLGIAGNHDLTHGSMVSFETQPVGVLVEGDAMHLLDESSVLFELDGFTVRVAGSSYHHAQADIVRDLKKDGATFLVTTGHFWFGKETGQFFGEPVYGPEYFESSESDALIIGHHHADQGIQQVKGRTFVAHGSMNRVGSHAGDMDRKPAVGLLEITKEGIVGKVARLRVPDAAEIFDLEKREAIVAERKELDEFMHLMANQVMGGDDVSTLMAEMVISPEVRSQVDNYLKDAEAEMSVK